MGQLVGHGHEDCALYGFLGRGILAGADVQPDHTALITSLRPCVAGIVEFHPHPKPFRQLSGKTHLCLLGLVEPDSLNFGGVHGATLPTGSFFLVGDGSFYRVKHLLGALIVPLVRALPGLVCPLGDLRV